MAEVYFIGDCHLGHKNVCKYRTEFDNVDKHNNLIYQNLLNTVSKRDTIYFMGDTCFNFYWLEALKSVSGKKVLILGNHDTDWWEKIDGVKTKVTIKDLSNTYDEIYSLVKYKEFWLSHCPLHEQELRGRMNIHGHVHYKTVPDSRYFNVSAEVINYKPISLQQIRGTLK